MYEACLNAIGEREMKGAEEFSSVFTEAEQINDLYILPSSHARGSTFRIYVLPNGEKAIENGGINPPLNKDSVEVYGVISGHLGWSEEYGWIHTGKWIEDFNLILETRKIAQIAKNKEAVKKNEERDYAEKMRISKLLDGYN